MAQQKWDEDLIKEKLDRKRELRPTARVKRLAQLAKADAAVEKGGRTLRPEDIKVVNIAARLGSSNLLGNLLGTIGVGNDADPTDSWIDSDPTDSWFDTDPTDAVHDISADGDAFRLTAQVTKS